MSPQSAGDFKNSLLQFVNKRGVCVSVLLYVEPTDTDMTLEGSCRILTVGKAMRRG